VRRWSVEQLQDCLGRARQNVPERAKLRELLALRAEEPSADSMLESRVFRALGPLMPFEVHFSTVLGGRVYVIDAAWPEAKVGAEIVGRAHRVASRSAFDRERRKLNELGAFGWTVAHLTAAMSAEEMIAAVGALLGRSRARRVPLRSKNDRNSRQARGEGSQRDQTPPQDQPSGASFIPEAGLGAASNPLGSGGSGGSSDGSDGSDARGGRDAGDAGDGRGGRGLRGHTGDGRSGRGDRSRPAPARPKA